MYIKLLDIINSISCFQLAVFSFFLIHKSRKKISNIILAIFFIVQFIVILNYLLISIFEKYHHFYLQIAYIYYPFEFLWGPLIFYYVKSQVRQGFRFKFTDIIHLAPFILASVFIISYYYAYDINTKYHIIKNGQIFKWLYYFSIPYYLLLFTYNSYALFLIIQYQKQLKNYCSFNVRQNLIWLKFVLYGYIIACLFVALTMFAGQYFHISNNVKMLCLFTPFLIFFNILFYKAMIQPYVIIQLDEKPKYSNSSLNNTDIQNYSTIIETFLTTKKPYLNPALTLGDLSDATGIPERTISQVMNQYWNQNFFSFINSYRVEEAKILLLSFDKNKTTMLGISFDAGFNSKTAFYDAFKKHTGITPTEYRKLKT